MISARLVHLIESHAEEILDRAQAQAHRESLAPTPPALDYELGTRALDLMHKLGDWLSARTEQDLAAQYERLGKQCFEEDIPLHEAVRGLSMLRRKMLDFAEDNLISNSSVELYAEEELARRLGRLVDALTIRLTLGYEQAIPKSMSHRATTH